MQPQDFLDAVDKIELSPNVKNSKEISEKAAVLFQTVGAINKRAFFISDFQKHACPIFRHYTYTPFFYK